MRFADAIACALAAVFLLALGACAGPGAKKEVTAPAAAPALSPAPATAQGPSGATAAPASLAVVPPDVVRAFEAALGALQAGKTQEAERQLVALTRSNPELGGPHANLGILYRRAGKGQMAIAELERAVQSNPQQPVYWNQLGIAYREQGQFSKAQEAYEKAIAIDAAYPAPNLNLGILFDLYLWDSKRALERYDRYLALTPGGDERVGKWIADLKNRQRAPAATPPKEKP